MDNLESTVVSTRIRLARNLDGYPFPHKFKSRRQAEEIINLLKLSLDGEDTVQLDGGRDIFQLVHLNSLKKMELAMLKENYLISQALINNRDFSAVFINREENISVMVNEEDHIRLQYYLKGFQLLKAYEILSAIDGGISDCVKYAYDEKLGYLTACPSNLGTGLRASVMLFLPAITRRPDLLQGLQEQTHLRGLTVRGAYGEGSLAEGYMYQISNEITLGHSEQGILDEVYGTVHTIVEMEVRAREEMVRTDPIAVRDACGRAYGILTNCVKLENKEFLSLMSDFKLGVAVGLYTVDSMESVNDLIVSMRDSNINRFANATAPLYGEDREVYRAECVQAKLKEIIRN